MYNMKTLNMPNMGQDTMTKSCYAVYTPLSNSQYAQSQYPSTYPQAPPPPTSQYPGPLGQFAANYAHYAQQQAAVAPQQQSQHDQAAYYAYQQQQQAYAQQQQEQEAYAQQQRQLLKQLYTNHPGQQGTTVVDTSVQPQESKHQANQYLTAEQYANYLSKQQNHVFNAQQQHVQDQYQHGYSTASPTEAALSPNAFGNGLSMEGSQAKVGPRNGLANTGYSSSNKVSHVKFQSGNLAYSF